MQAHDEIDAVIAAWTVRLEKNALAERLQAVGIAAGPVNKVSDIPFDPHLRERGFMQMVPHSRPLYGYLAHPHPTTPWVAAGRERTRLSEFRFAGEDNEAVMKSWLGLTAEEVAGLEARGALFRGEPEPEPERPALAGAPTDTDFAQRLRLPAATVSRAQEAAG
jgi:crotonobetainyl-CoA:carnitine CoA-transferase CaiB-like acyl-CoA transferase